VAELDAQATQPDFWNDNEKAQATLKEQARVKGAVVQFEAQRKEIEDAEVLLDLVAEVGDESALAEVAAALAQVEATVGQMELTRMLSGRYDREGAIVDINAGAGGTDAQDWAEMLQRMYSRWAQRRAFDVELLDLQPGDEAGVKSVTLGITGELAYGYLRAEAGVHRLVRISPFDSNARRQTSFASVAVSPDIDTTAQLDIDDKELRVDVMRSGGAGGQHVNKTESAVRITHLPTGLAVHCQAERSQHKNRSTAMRILRSRLIVLEQKKIDEKMTALHGQKKAIEWGSQIRSYVLAPYRMVSDHRIDMKVGNVDAVLDGDLDGFMVAALLHMASDTKGA
jgi:peptide chain release factor 2